MALRFQTNYDFTDVPIPTTRQPPPSGATIRRAKTLTKPERGVAAVPLINPTTFTPSSASPRPAGPDDYNGSTSWRYFSRAVTFWAPDMLLSSLGGLKDKAVRRAWREKVTLCFLIACLCAIVGFITVGFQKVLCPENSISNFLVADSTTGVLAVDGIMYNTSSIALPSGVSLSTLTSAPGQDITPYFTRSASDFTSCKNLQFRVALDEPCATSGSCPLGNLNSSATFKGLGLVKTAFIAGYTWDQIANLTGFLVLDGAVVNLTPYLTRHPSAVPSDNVDAAIRTMTGSDFSSTGKDAIRLFYNRADLKTAIPCIKERYYAGNIDKVTPGCFVSSLFLYVGLIVILTLVLVRFVMACIFNWFLSERLAGNPSNHDLNRSAISPAVMPEGANVSIDNKNGTAPWAGGPKKLNKNKKIVPSSSSTTLVNGENGSAPIMSLAQIGAELFAVCLVTCYSEGEESLRTTLDSISTTDYSDKRKLLFIVADGMITGDGEEKSTPDICVSLLEADTRFGSPMPMTYASVGSGAKAQNRAMVYAGHYST